MAINFNSLPTEKPAMGTIIPKGNYIATIRKAEMRKPKDESKPEYLNLEMDITDPVSNMSMGKFWAIITESDAPLPRYQLSRFITALHLPITGEFELKDLTKMVVNKQLRVDICPEERKDNQPPQRSVVDINAGQIFYPMEEPTVEAITAAEATFTAPQAQTQPMSQY